MRKTKITINDTDYTMVMSTRVLVELEERYGDADKALIELLSSGNVSDAFYLLALVLDAGYRYDKLNGHDSQKPPTHEELIDLIGLDDYGEIIKSMRTVSTAEPQVEIQLKKEETSRAGE